MSILGFIPYLINIAIFVITFITVMSFFWDKGTFSPARIKKALIFYTTQSNILCAISALCICLFGDAQWAFVLKYIGTVAVTVTMLTVIFFLGPSFGTYKGLFTGPDFFLHLFNPLLALVSLCVYERRPMSLGISLTGLLPVLLYGTLYLYKTIYADEGKRWDDFYGYNKNGRWQLSFALMVLGTALICFVMYGVSKI